MTRKKKYIRNTIMAVALAGVSFGMGASTIWLWKIDDVTISEKEFRLDHESFFTLIAWQMNMTPEKLSETLNSANDSIPQVAFLKHQLAPENFADQYERVLVLNLEANKHHFDDQELVKARLAFFNKYYRAQMYLQEEVDKKKITVTDEEVEQAWAAEKENNEQLSSIPIDQGLVYMRQQLELQKMAAVQEELIDDLMKEYSIKKNPEFDAIIKGETAKQEK